MRVCYGAELEEENKYKMEVENNIPRIQQDKPEKSKSLRTFHSSHAHNLFSSFPKPNHIWTVCD